MKIGILVGTRPEVIKMAPVIRECITRGVGFTLIHSNQHYSESMDAIFFKELNLPSPDYNLGVGSGLNGNQIGSILIALEPILIDEQIDVLLVQGDTNTVAAGALAASKLGIKVGHIEAGLRSFDKTMPEEGNRIITDHISDYLFAVSSTQFDILKNEGIDSKKIYRVGNTIVDSVLQSKKIADAKSDILTKLKLTKNDYTLFTAHRASNVDTEKSLREVLELVGSVPGLVCWPIHPRTKKNIKNFHLEIPSNVIVTEPLGFMDFLKLEMSSRMIITDSGGLQEEACILGVPCLTIRENTERPETIHVGANQLIGRDLVKLKAGLESPIRKWENPFGDGHSSSAILDIIMTDFGLKFEEKRKSFEDKVCVVGMGYMGLPTAILMAKSGYQVIGVDINKSRVDEITAGKFSTDEPGIEKKLSEVLLSKKFSCQTEMPAADIYIVAVPTPHLNSKCDLSFVVKACQEIKRVIKDEAMVIIESTIKPNTCERYIKPIFDKEGLNIDIAHCPERAIPGNTLYELVHNDRIIGGLTDRATEKAFKLYKSFCKGDIFKTKAINAECAKLMENTYRDVNIALANELSMIADDIGFDIDETIRLANRHPRVNILSPGAGVGGHCIPIDPWFLTEDTEKAHLIKTARQVNNFKPLFFIKSHLEKLKVSNPKIGLLGAAYKPDVDDARESPCKVICEYLEKNRIEFKVHDPYVKDWDYPICSFDEVKKWADTLIIVTQHSAFKEYQL